MGLSYWQCKVCMQTFICTTSEVKCKEHAEAKHPKSDLFTCFPHLKKWCQQSSLIAKYVSEPMSLYYQCVPCEVKQCL